MLYCAFEKGKQKLAAVACCGIAAAGIAAFVIYKYKEVSSGLGIEEFKKIGKFNKDFAGT